MDLKLKTSVAHNSNKHFVALHDYPAHKNGEPVAINSVIAGRQKSLVESIE